MNPNPSDADPILYKPTSEPSPSASASASKCPVVPPLPPQLPPVPEGRCASYQSLKKRYCKGRVLPNSLYCGNHKHLNFSSDLSISCPIGCGNVFLKSSLKSHLKKCNLARMQKELEKQVYYSKGINLPKPSNPSSTSSSSPSSSPPTLNTLSSYTTLALLIQKLHFTLSPLPSTDLSLTPPLPSTSFLSQKIPLGTQKHILQIDSLTSNLLSTSIISQKTESIIELGSGRGMLGLVVAGTLSSRFNKNVDLTFIERGTSRRQADKFSKRERSEGEEGEGEVDLTKVNINRIRCDLSDVDMSRLPLKPETSNIAIAKHLCGAGTDIGLRACLKLKGLKGVSFATCCHGVCSYDTFVGRAYMRKLFEREGGVFGEEVFNVIKKWTGASTADDSDKSVNRDRTKDKVDAKGEEVFEHNVVEEKNDGIPGAGVVCGDEKINFTKQELGRMCQRLIDYGRCVFVREELGLEEGWGTYVAEEVSPQNCWVWGRKREEGGEGEEREVKKRKVE